MAAETPICLGRPAACVESNTTHTTATGKAIDDPEKKVGEIVDDFVALEMNLKDLGH